MSSYVGNMDQIFIKTPLKTTFGYVVDLPATSIVQSYCYVPLLYQIFSYHLRCILIT